MTKQVYNEKEITMYLLGSLPEERAGQFDELSFTDDEFASALKVTEKELIDSYVQGELSGKTLEQFNTFYLASPLRREKVRFAETFQTFAEKNADTIETGREAKTETKEKRTVAGWFSALNIFTIPSLSFQWGFAVATLVLMLFGGWLFYQNYRLRQQVSDTEARRIELQQREKQLEKEIAEQQTNNTEKQKELERVREEIAKLESEKQELERQRKAEQERIAKQQQEQQKQTSGEIITASFVLLPPRRDGSGQPATISIPEKTNQVEMRLELESDDYPSYRIALKNPNTDQTLWRSGKLKSRNKSLNIRFKRSLLKSQIYTLEVSGMTANGAIEIISGYSFKVVEQ